MLDVCDPRGRLREDNAMIHSSVWIRPRGAENQDHILHDKVTTVQQINQGDTHRATIELHKDCNILAEVCLQKGFEESKRAHKLLLCIFDIE